MWNIFLVLCIHHCYSSLVPQDTFSRYIQGNITDEDAALKFLDDYDREAKAMCTTVMNSQWDFNTNITDESKERMLETQMNYAKFQTGVWQKATSYAWKTFSDPKIRRQFRVLSVLGRSALPDKKLKEIQNLLADMRQTYNQNRVCPYVIKSKESDDPESIKCNLAIEPDLTHIMANSKDVDELTSSWKEWHEKTGRPLRSKFIRYVELSNEAARLNGFKDLGDQWRSPYDVEDLSSQLDDLWRGIQPLYKQLHAYVRRKLNRKYGSKLVPPTGAIPAHLLGNMWAQSWSNLYDSTLPFRTKKTIDVTEELKRQHYHPARTFQLADQFFVSLGMKPVPDSFWNLSMLEKPLDRDVVCHASAWDFCDGRDFRIKQCTKISMDDFVTAHHELGHIQYYMQYANQPLVFREGANPGFHEAVGDVISLSVSTPKHLQRIGLLEETSEAEDIQVDINYLYALALEKVAFLPFGLLLDQWRWKVFSGEIPFNKMNEAWWDLRLRYQGIVPPINRTERDFDAGAKYHVPANSPYIKYFVSFVLQFQIHKALCDASGHVGPLHQCDIYESRVAGNLLTDIMKMGSSKPWPDSIRVLTRGKMNRMDSSAIVEYFKPLMDWLQRQNENEKVGWPGMSFGTVIKPSLLGILLPFLVIVTSLRY